MIKKQKYYFSKNKVTFLLMIYLDKMADKIHTYENRNKNNIYIFHFLQEDVMAIVASKDFIFSGSYDGEIKVFRIKESLIIIEL